HMRRDAGDNEGVAVRRRSRDRGGTNHAAGTGAILNKELLLEDVRQGVGYDPPQCVGGSAGRKRRANSHRLVWPNLCVRWFACNAQERKQRNPNAFHFLAPTPGGAEAYRKLSPTPASAYEGRQQGCKLANPARTGVR